MWLVLARAGNVKRGSERSNCLFASCVIMEKSLFQSLNKYISKVDAFMILKLVLTVKDQSRIQANIYKFENTRQKIKVVFEMIRDILPKSIPEIQKYTNKNRNFYKCSRSVWDVL